jgi:hypothetical protein
VPVARLREVARTLMPGTPAWRDRFVPLVLESPEQLRALGVARTADAATYRLRLADGRTVERRLVALPAAASRPIGASRQWMLAPPDTAGPAAWRALRAARELPWSLRDPGAPFRLAAREDLDAVVIDLRQTFDAPGRPLAPFLDSARAEIARRRPRNLVVDLRLNGGGNLQLARDFMQSLPTLVPGHVFLLTSPWTFSAAISSAGYAKQADPRRVLVVGEPVGDRLEFFAEGGPQRLPNSGIQVGISTQRHDYRNGCRQATDCHPPVVRFPIALPTLDPDIAAPWSMAAYRQGRDPAFEAIARWLSREARPRG